MSEKILARRKPRIAIAGASGRVGATLTHSLARDPVDVVALTRRPDQAQFPPGVAMAAVDFTLTQTLDDALAGADRLFVAHGTSPQQVANEIALIDRAVAAGIGHVVKLSAMGPATHLNPLAWHMQIEAHLARQPIASTVLRPSAFADILRRSAGQIADGAWAGAAGEGRVNFIDTRDVAEVARRALLETVSPGSQRAFHLTGPRAWTLPQVAEELSRLLGRPVIYGHRSAEAVRSELIVAGTSPFVADLLAGLDQMFHDSVLGETTSTVVALTGQAPRSLTDWLTENLGLFRKTEAISA